MLGQDVLTALNHSNDGYYYHFTPLNHPCVHLINKRLNLIS